MSTTIHTNCLRCGRKLTSQTSTARGYGRSCAAKTRQAQNTAELRDFKPEQIEAARELIEDGGIVQIRPRVWRTVSTDGREYHLTALNVCNCKAGLRGTRCYHRAAAHILAA